MAGGNVNPRGVGGSGESPPVVSVCPMCGYPHEPACKITEPQKEEELQELVARYNDNLGLLWFHPPNGGHRHAAVGAKLKRQGVKAGVPDVWILDTPAGHDCRGVVIELKVKGRKPTPEQVEWLAALEQRNWLTFCVNGLQEYVNVMRVLGW